MVLSIGNFRRLLSIGSWSSACNSHSSSKQFTPSYYNITTDDYKRVSWEYKLRSMWYINRNNISLFKESDHSLGTLHKQLLCIFINISYTYLLFLIIQIVNQHNNYSLRLVPKFPAKVNSSPPREYQWIRRSDQSVWLQMANQYSIIIIIFENLETI